MKTHYIVQSAVSQNCGGWGTYKRIAVLEVDAGLRSVSMISDRAVGCHRVVKTWERLNVGKTGRCAYAVAMLKAVALADKLNGATT